VEREDRRRKRGRKRREREKEITAIPELLRISSSRPAQAT
jgi:hypothetical protein